MKALKINFYPGQMLIEDPHCERCQQIRSKIGSIIYLQVYVIIYCRFIDFDFRLDYQLIPNFRVGNFV